MSREPALKVVLVVVVAWNTSPTNGLPFRVSRVRR